MMPLRHTILLLVVVLLAACALPLPEPSVAEIATPETSLQPRAPLVTATGIPSAGIPTATALSGYPVPAVVPTYYPAGYPGPVTPAPPTETPVPLPVVATLPLTATWFYDAADMGSSCGTTLYARNADGTIVEWDRPLVAAVSRPNATPLLVSCTPDTTAYNQEPIHVVDMAAGTSVELDLNRTDTVYQLYSPILSPDGRYLLVDGNPQRYTTINSKDFWGMYRMDVTTGEVVPMIQYIADLTDVQKTYNEAGVTWDSHIPLVWDTTGLTVHTMASGDGNLWRFTWQEGAPLPYSVAAGTLTVESLDSDVSWPADTTIPYTEPALPEHITQPILVYASTP